MAEVYWQTYWMLNLLSPCVHMHIHFQSVHASLCCLPIVQSLYGNFKVLIETLSLIQFFSLKASDMPELMVSKDIYCLVSTLLTNHFANFSQLFLYIAKLNCTKMLVWVTLVINWKRSETCITLPWYVEFGMEKIRKKRGTYYYIVRVVYCGSALFRSSVWHVLRYVMCFVTSHTNAINGHIQYTEQYLKIK